MNNLRETVGEILKAEILEDKWEETFSALDKEGKITLRVLEEIVVLLCKRMEKLEGIDYTKPTKSEEKVGVFNPLTHDFTYRWRDETNHELLLIIKAKEMAYFSPVQAKHMAKHLTDAIYNERGQKTNAIDDKQEIRKQVEVVLDES